MKKIVLIVLAFSAVFATAAAKSEVKIVNNIPRLFINGKEMDSGAVNVYYLPEMGIAVQGKNEVPRYASEKWLINTKALIDQAVSNNARLIMLNVWWSDLDKSVSRPKNIADNLDFSGLDAIFDYAGRKETFIMPIFIFFPFAPDWWLKENNFPPYNKGKVCDFCETDSYGNVYNNPSMNSEKVQQDWGCFIEAVVKRYRLHSALAGWFIGVGATGEDGYGPNYINLMGFGNAPEKIERKPLMFTDYSPYFERKFKEWAGFKIPKPEEMVKNEEQVRSFPDPTDILALAAGDDQLGNLTAKGRDFYEFRNYMRRLDRKYYSDLFRKNDPGHVLIFSASSEDFLSDGQLSDGIGFSLAGTIDHEANNLFYYLALDIVKKALNHKKLAIISSEHVCDGALRSRTGECETPEQLRFMEDLGKSVKCAGGIFAYTAAPYDKESFSNGSWLPPVWFSEQAMSTAGRINNFYPGTGSVCSLIREVYSNNGCDSRDGPRNCGLLNRIYGYYCNGNIPGPGRCGDGICDSFERQSGKCPQDCR